MFDGDFRKRKTVNLKPKKASENRHQTTNQLINDNRTSATSRFEKLTKSQAFLQDASKKRQLREFEKSAETSAIIIQ